MDGSLDTVDGTLCLILTGCDAFYESRLNADAAPLGPDNPPTPESFRPVPVVSGQKVLRGFEIASVTKAGDRVKDDEYVLAVELEGQPRAYPLNIMTGPEREIFNDELGGHAIAATW